MRTPLIAFLLLLAPLAFAQQSDREIGYTFKSLYTDNYVFRGKLYGPEETWLNSFSIGRGNWAYEVLSAEGLDDFELEDGGLFFDGELTHSITYTTLGRGNRVTTVGYTYYDYGDNGILPDTQEISIRRSTSGGWNPSYGVTMDFDTYKGTYFDFSITRALPFSRSSNLILYMLVGGSYNMDEEVERADRGDIGTITEPGFFEDDGINHGQATLKWVYQSSNWFKFETAADYHYGFDDFLHDDAPVDFDLVYSVSFTIFL